MGHNPLVPLTDVRGGQRAGAPLRLVLFSGGRGAGVLTRQLVAHPSISLTIAINGYDDGASTGEVRRFLRDSLGPSDFRKNAARLATELRSCSPALVELLDRRLPAGSSDRARGGCSGQSPAIGSSRPAMMPALVRASARASRGARAVCRPADGDRRAVQLLRLQPREPRVCRDLPENGRDFNRTVDEYAALCGLPQGLIENVTDGTNAWLVGLDADGRLLASEEEIVDATRPNRIRDIFLVDGPMGPSIAWRSTAAPSRARDILHGVPRLSRSTRGSPRRSHRPI